MPLAVVKPKFCEKKFAQLWFEQERLSVQAALDGQKSQKTRNQFGQFATPPLLADQIVRLTGISLPQNGPVTFLEPAFGTGSFYSAVLRAPGFDQIKRSVGFELDSHYAEPARELWKNEAIDITIADFTTQEPPRAESERFNLVVTNPPYVRHHHIHSEDKRRLQRITEERRGFRPSGLSGLYAYFLYLAHDWMQEGGIAAWLIPSEFMYVNYGRQIREYLLEDVTLLQVHRFDPHEAQFDDALVSSAVVLFKKEPPPPGHDVLFTYGGSLLEPAQSRHISVAAIAGFDKWNNLFSRQTKTLSKNSVSVGDLFRIKRGLATGANKFFILSAEEIEKKNLPVQFFRPILPSPRYLDTEEVFTDGSGVPILDKRLVLLSCNLTERVVEEKHPKLWDYLQEGVELGIKDRYLCSKRSPWYSQEEREPAPILCTYMGRSRNGDDVPFRFIRNHSSAIAANVYLNLYPNPELCRALSRKPELIRSLWELLRNMTRGALISNGRTYGGGLHKLEPKELAGMKFAPDQFSKAEFEAMGQGELFCGESTGARDLDG